MNKLPLEKRVQILQLLVDGSSMRSVERLVGVSINTVTKLLLDAGFACEAFHDRTVRGLQTRRLQCHEIWSFSREKEHNAPPAQKDSANMSDICTFTALDSDTMLIASWLAGNRTAEVAQAFMLDLAGRIETNVQITTDGFDDCLQAVGGAFGTPDEVKILTSLVERGNFTMRMSMNRFARQTNSFSKKYDNHRHALALFFVFYNWVRPHKSLGGETPAMASGLTNHAMSMVEVVGLIDAQAELGTR